jgi:chromosome segregation ATPase
MRICSQKKKCILIIYIIFLTGESNEVEASTYGNSNEAEEVQETEEEVEETAAEEVQDMEEEVEETEAEIEETEEEIEEETNAYGDTNEAEEVQDMEEEVEELEEEIEEIEEEAEEEVSAAEKEEEAEEVEANEYEMALSGSIMACALVGAGLVAAKKKRRYSDEKHTSFLSMESKEDASRSA